MWKGNKTGEKSASWALSRMLLQNLANLVCDSNLNCKLNIAILKHNNVVDWVLKIMLLLCSDFSRHNELTTSVLAAAFTIIESILKDGPTNKTVFSIFQYVLITLPPRNKSMSWAEEFTMKEAIDLGDFWWQKLEQNYYKSKALGKESVFYDIRLTFLQILINFPKDATSKAASLNSGSNGKRAIIQKYADVLSASWFVALVRPGLDRETNMLSLELIALCLQASQEFNSHFVLEGGFDLIISVFGDEGHDLSKVVQILLMLILGLPVIELPSFVNNFEVRNSII